MAILSVLRTGGQNISRLYLRNSKNGAETVLNGSLLRQIRQMSDHKMAITPSRWQWHKFKDYLHFYIMLGVIPCTLISLYVNVFVGPAQLAEIPEDYVPKHWEYYSHPITRFIARNLTRSYQQEYEMLLHGVYEEDYKSRLRALEKKVKAKMGERGDYQAYYYQPITGHYTRYVGQQMADIARSAGEN
nr:EOG090X0FIE [Eulimnadia texana]